MRVTVIGGSGHIGTYLVPRLVRAGHDVVNITRGSSTVYRAAPEWQDVRQVVADRQRQDTDGVFGDTVLAQRPDVVIDLLCFTLESADALVTALRGNVGHLIHCGTLWRYGPARKVPIHESAGTPPFDEYGIQKEAIARMLRAETASGGLVTTSLHPGHIVGPGWGAVGPLGNSDPRVWWALSAGETLRIPGDGTQFLHHVHADDVAQLFALAVDQRDAAAGEDFHAVAPSALSVRGYAEIVAGWFGQEAALEEITWAQFRAETDPEQAVRSWGHLYRNHYLSIEKSRSLLGYAPRYEPEDAILEAVRAAIEAGRLDVAAPLRV